MLQHDSTFPKCLPIHAHDDRCMCVIDPLYVHCVFLPIESIKNFNSFELCRRQGQSRKLVFLVFLLIHHFRLFADRYRRGRRRCFAMQKQWFLVVFGTRYMLAATRYNGSPAGYGDWRISWEVFGCVTCVDVLKCAFRSSPHVVDEQRQTTVSAFPDAQFSFLVQTYSLAAL